MDFRQIYRRYATDVHRFSLYLSGNPGLAEDLTSETFVRALTTRAPLRVDTVRAYLLAIARNLYLDWLRHERGTDPIDELPDAVDVAPRPDRVAEGRRRLNTVLDALRYVPRGDREALALSANEGLSHLQIAAILGCSVPAVKVRIHRARARLREILGEEGTWHA